MIVGALNNLLPQIGGAHFAIYPLAIGTLCCTLFLERGRRFGDMHQLEFLIILHRLHQGISHTDGNIEIAQIAFVFGADEFLDVGVIATQHAHLCAAPCTGGFDGFAGTIKNTHIRNRTTGARVGAFDMSSLRANRGKIIADPTTAPHGFCGLLQCIVDARPAAAGTGDGIAHRLYETVDQRRLYLQAGGRVDTTGWYETVFLCEKESFFPLCALFSLLGLCQTTCNTVTHILY